MKKKIIFLLNHFQYSDGVARALINIVNYLDEDKFDITIKPLYKCDLKLKEELNENIRLEKCFGFYFKGFAKIANKIPLKMMYKKFINYKYDIEVGFQCDLSTKLVAHSFNNKAVHIAWMHGYEIYQDEYPLLDKIVCVSKYCRDKAEKELLKSCNLTYCYNLLNSEKILNEVNEPTKIDDTKEIKFVTVGRLSPEKGFDRLINIFNQLKHENYKFRLVIVGDGPEREKIHNLVSEYELENDIIFVGYQKNPYKFINNSDIYICSSFSEGYNTACAESAIIGVPIITTNVPGGSEIIADCNCGLLTEIDDNSLKEGIKQVLDNPNIIEEWKSILKENNYKFSYNYRGTQIANLFEEFLNLSNNK